MRVNLDTERPETGDATHHPARLLEGVRVLDLSNVLAGPFCTYQLALLGAEVIKVENPESGDLARQLGADPRLNRRNMGASFIAQNGGKRSLTLNLKDKAGKDIFRRLVAKSEVVVENFRPGVMSRLQLDYPRLKAIKPDLIYCAISGFGQDGPLRDRPAYDQIIQGFSGIMSITGTPQASPLRVGYPVCDTIGGMTAAFAIVASLLAARQTGEGRFVDVSMLDSALVSMGWAVSNYLTADVVPTALGNDNVTAAPSGTFATGDGLINIAANKQEHFIALMRAIGRPDLVTDPRFAERDERKHNRAALNAEVVAALAARSAAEWDVILTGAGIPVGQVLTIPEVLAQPQIKARRLLQTLPCETDGERAHVRVVRTGYRLSDGEPTARTAPPVLGQHTDGLLRSLLDLPDDEIADLRRRSVV